MDLDAVVWLMAGVGLGLGLSLVLLIAYSGVEGRRLRRRLAAQRPAPAPLVAEPVLDPKPAEPVPAPTRPTASAPVAAVDTPAAPEATEEVEGVAADESAGMDEAAVEPEPQVRAAVDRPEPAALPRKPQSVEEIFAEAFADDRYVTPRPPGPVSDKG